MTDSEPDPVLDERATRDANLATLKGMGFSVAGNLPIWSEWTGKAISLRPKIEICRRLMCSEVATAFIWSPSVPEEELRAYIDRSDLMDVMADTEQEIFGTPRVPSAHRFKNWGYPAILVPVGVHYIARNTVRNVIMLLLVSCCSTVIAQEPAADVDSVSVRLVRTNYGQHFKGRRPLNPPAKPGTALVFLVESPNAFLVRVSRDGSKLEQFTDDKGTSLLSVGPDLRQGIGWCNYRSKDRKAGMIGLFGLKPPTKGAKFVSAKGVLSASLATNQKTVKSQPFAIKAGQKVKAGDLELEITNARKPWFGDNPLEITFETKPDLFSVITFRLEDTSGKRISTRRTADRQYESSHRVTYALGRKVDECVMVLRVFDQRDVKIPFDVSVDLETVTSKPFTMKVGEKVNLDAFSFTVTRISKPRVDNKTVDITFETTQDLNSIATYRFEDLAGRSIESSHLHTGGFGFGKKVTRKVTYTLANKVDKCVMVLQLWRDAPGAASK